MAATVRVADSEEGLLTGCGPALAFHRYFPAALRPEARGNARQDRQSFFLRALNLP